MRVLGGLFLQLVSVMGSARLNEDILGTFLSVEILDVPTEVRTTLPPIISRLAYRDLLKWFIMNEETFVTTARRVIVDSHSIAMEIPDEADMLQNNMQPLRNQGLTEEEILDRLSRRYYRALRNIVDLQKMAAVRK